MASKSNIRSIRFSDELYELIDRQEGDTFTQKFENLVTRCVWELPRKEKELEGVRKAIQQEREELRIIQQNKRKFEQNLRDMNWALENASRQVIRLTAALESIVP